VFCNKIPGWKDKKLRPLIGFCKKISTQAVSIFAFQLFCSAKINPDRDAGHFAFCRYQIDNWLDGIWQENPDRII
jgi:hypothetical protein